MFNLLLVLQRSILLPLTFMTIITDWLNVLKRASDAGVTITNNEIDSWTTQIAADKEADAAHIADLEAKVKQLAEAKAKQRIKNKDISASSF